MKDFKKIAHQVLYVCDTLLPPTVDILTHIFPEPEFIPMWYGGNQPCKIGLNAHLITSISISQN